MPSAPAIVMTGLGTQSASVDPSVGCISGDSIAVGRPHVAASRPAGLAPPTAIALDRSSSLHWTVLALAGPALLDQFLQTLLMLSDLKLAGSLEHSEDMLSAVGMVGQLMLMVGVLFNAIGVGAMALVARSIGAGDRPQADRVTRQAMLLGVIIGVVAAGTMMALAEPMLAALGLTGRALDSGVMFTRVMMPGLGVGALMFMGGACLRGAGDTSGALIAAGVANIVNIAVAWTLCNGWLGVPAMGLTGIAVGTLSAYAVGGLFMLHLVRAGRRGVRARVRPIALDRDLVSRILRIGSFAGIESLTFAAASTVVASIVAHPPLGENDFASFMLTLRLHGLSFLPGYAFGIAGGALVGQSLGAGRLKQASRYGWISYLWGGGLMTVIGAGLVIFPDPLVRFFTRADTAPEVIDQAVQMLRICGFIQPFLALLMILPGCLKAAGDTRYPAAITFVCVLGFRLPGCYVIARFLPFGVVGVWCVMMAELVLRSIVMTWRFIHGGWKKIRV